MINFSELKNIDWKNIDVAKISQGLLEKKELLAQGISVGLAAIILISIFSHHQSQAKAYHQQIQQLREKIDLIQDYDKNTKQLKAFLSTLPKELDDDRFSDQIIDYAAQNNVTIVSVTPGQRKIEGRYEVARNRLTVRANAYKDAVFFIRAIESSVFALRIDSCQISMQDHSREDRPADDVEITLDIQMEITLVKIKK